MVCRPGWRLGQAVLIGIAGLGGLSLASDISAILA
jgi:hypothetical protein